MENKIPKLESGMIVKTRNGSFYIIVFSQHSDIDMMISLDNYDYKYLDEYNVDLFNFLQPQNDIVTVMLPYFEMNSPKMMSGVRNVYQFINKSKIIWERKENRSREESKAATIIADLESKLSTLKSLLRKENNNV